MSAPEQVIILAAGRGDQADGIVKVLIRHPRTRKTVLDHSIEAFKGKRIVVVVGFRAIQVMEHHPELEYVINNDWAITNNAMSLGLALNESPTYVISGDMFLNRELVEDLDRRNRNLALVEARENRTLTAVHCMVRDDGSIAETYQGQVRSHVHPEALGLFKISDPKVLKVWKRVCIDHGNLSAGLTLPYDIVPIHAEPRNEHVFEEINTPMDYQRLIRKCRGS